MLHYALLRYFNNLKLVHKTTNLISIAKLKIIEPSVFTFADFAANYGICNTKPYPTRQAKNSKGRAK